MSKFRFDFLNWRPDAEDYSNDGLVTADNLLHSEEGYKQVLQQTATSFLEESPLFGGNSTVSVKARPFGFSGELAVAYIHNPTVTTTSLRIGVKGNVAFTATTMGTLASIGAARIISFSTCEFAQAVVIAAQAEASLLAGGTTTYPLCGTIEYTLTSV